MHGGLETLRPPLSQCEMVIQQHRESSQPNFGVMGCDHPFWVNKELQAHQKTLVQAAGQVGLGLFSSSAHLGSKTPSYVAKDNTWRTCIYTIWVHVTVMKNDGRSKSACPEFKDKNPGKEKENAEHVWSLYSSPVKQKRIQYGDSGKRQCFGAMSSRQWRLGDHSPAAVFTHTSWVLETTPRASRVQPLQNSALRKCSDCGHVHLHLCL